MPSEEGADPTANDTRHEQDGRDEPDRVGDRSGHDARDRQAGEGKAHHDPGDPVEGD